MSKKHEKKTPDNRVKHIVTELEQLRGNRERLRPAFLLPELFLDVDEKIRRLEKKLAQLKSKRKNRRGIIRKRIT